MNPVDWTSGESHWMINPQLPREELQLIDKMKLRAPQLSGVIWIRSSGSQSQGRTRFFALTKVAFLESARSVNQFLECRRTDIWLKTLPSFHVGGLAQWARAFDSKSQLVEQKKWNAKDFCKLAESSGVTLSALVPTQVFDLVQLELIAPPRLRAVIVGGDHLSQSLYFQARKLGWPILPSYGMTEVASQIATASLNSLESEKYPGLEILPHMELSTVDNGQLTVRSKSLFVGELIANKGEVLWSPRQGEFVAADQVKIQGSQLQFLSRSQSSVKVLGEWVSLQKIAQQVESEISMERIHEFQVLACPHERDGNEICIGVESHDFQFWESRVAQVNLNLAAYEKIKCIYFLNSIPRSELGKPLPYAILKKLKR